VYNDIIRDGRVTRGSIGVQWDTNPKPEVLRAMGLKGGVLVRDVKAGGPSEKAGLLPEDVIIAFNGKPVKDGDDLMALVADTPVGATAKVTVDRDGKTHDYTLTIQDRTKVFSDDPRVVGSRVTPREAEKPEGEPAKFGIQLRQSTEQERQMAGVKQGVTVTRVEPDTFADDVGLAERDIITAINRKPVNSREDVVALQKSLKPGDAVVFRVVRSPRGGNVAARNGGPTASANVQFLSGTLPEN
jgi:serine protease Do